MDENSRVHISFADFKERYMDGPPAYCPVRGGAEEHDPYDDEEQYDDYLNPRVVTSVDLDLVENWLEDRPEGEPPFLMLRIALGDEQVEEKLEMIRAFVRAGADHMRKAIIRVAETL